MPKRKKRRQNTAVLPAAGIGSLRARCLFLEDADEPRRSKPWTSPKSFWNERKTTTCGGGLVARSRSHGAPCSRSPIRPTRASRTPGAFQRTATRRRRAGGAARPGRGDDEAACEALLERARAAAADEEATRGTTRRSYQSSVPRGRGRVHDGSRIGAARLRPDLLRRRRARPRAPRDPATTPPRASSTTPCRQTPWRALAALRPAACYWRETDYVPARRRLF